MPHRDTLIVVSSNPDDAPVLSRLPFEHMAADRLVPARATAKSASQLRTAVAASAGVFADLSRLTAAEIESNAVFKAARDVGTPMVFVRTGDGLGLSKITGLGLDTAEGEVVLMQTLADNKTLVHVIGDVQVQEGDLETLTMDPETRTPVFERFPNVDPVTRVQKADTARSAAAVSDFLSDHGLLAELSLPQGREALTKSDTDPTCYSGSCVQWYYTADYGGPSGVTGQNEVLYQWGPIGNGQSPSIDIRYIITLYDSLNPQMKYVTFHTEGYINTNGLDSDGSTDRGYYNEDMFFVTEFQQYTNGTPSQTLRLASTSPGNQTDDGATATTGGSLSIAANVTEDNSGATFTYTTNWDYRRPIANFHIADTSSPVDGLGKARWVYSMASSTGGSYSGWGDLVDFNIWGRGSLRGLPDIAKYSLQPATLSIWSVQRSFQDTARFRLKARQDVRRVWRSKKGNIFTYDEFSTTGYTAQANRYVWVDFGTVHQSSN